MADTNQPPFMAPSFVQQTPANLGGGGATPYSGPMEDGPGLFTNPSNSSTVVRYTGQSQTATINVAYSNNYPPTKPPRQQLPTWASTPNRGTLGVGTIVPLPLGAQPAQVRMFLQGGNLYIVDDRGTAFVVNTSVSAPAFGINAPTK
jgi:hypothetical protein